VLLYDIKIAKDTGIGGEKRREEKRREEKRREEKREEGERRREREREMFG
jgi:hypothetical protein